MSEKLPRVAYPGVLKFGDIEFSCAVLNNGMRVISGTGFMKGMGMYRSGALSVRRKEVPGGAQVPLFLAYKNLKPFIDDDLFDVLNTPVEHLPQKGNRVQEGIRAEVISKICEVWLRARDEGVLKKTQRVIATKCDIIIRALAHVGIIALIDEVTGYQYIRTRNALEEILDKFIRNEFGKWAKTFPDEFYEHMFRLRGWPYNPKSVKRPGVIGRYTLDLVYKRLAPGVLEALKRKEPRKKHKYFQWLTEDVGDPKLREHLVAVIALMKASNTWDRFYGNMQRALPQYGETIDMFPELWGGPDDGDD
jgi:hypothetical protein